MADKDIILETLTQLEFEGTYVDVQGYWIDCKIEHKDMLRILQKLFDYGYAQHYNGNRFVVIITSDKGIYALRNPDKMNEDGEVIDNQSVSKKEQKKEKSTLWQKLERSKLLWEIGVILALIYVSISNNKWIWLKLTEIFGYIFHK